MASPRILALSISTVCLGCLISGCQVRGGDESGESRERAESESVKPPAAVLSVFRAGHSAAEHVRWVADGQNFESEFEIEGKRMSVVSDATGEALETESEVAVSDLSPSITDYIRSHYDDHDITLAEKSVSKDATTFEVRLGESGERAIELVFDEKGAFVGESQLASGEEDEMDEGVESDTDDERGEGMESDEDDERGEGMESDEDDERSEALDSARRYAAGQIRLAYILPNPRLKRDCPLDRHLV